jgi:5-methyltetrahydrofolate--homocysteine methyltransferase
MGTQLMLAGLEQGACGELWNLTHPERVLAIQRQYVDAGTDCLITNTFGANRITLEGHHYAAEAASINQAGARIAREAFGNKPGFVLGDIGPVGGMLEPYGELKAEDVRQALLEQARALVGAGVDAIILETQTALEEIGLGIEAAQEAGARCVIASFAYDRSADGKFYRTMMGVSPEQAAAFAQEKGAHVIALNCGRGMDMEAAAKVIPLYRSASTLFTMAQPNAGQPVLENMKAVYKQSPEDMSAMLPSLLQAGVNIVGSCCGSTPEHTRAIREGINSYQALL